MTRRVTSREQAEIAVLSEFEGLGEGESRSGQVCPACEGGSSKEASLSVSRRDGVLLYNCHRASCDFRGSLGLAATVGARTPRAEGSAERPYIPVSPVDKATVRFLGERYRVPREILEAAGLGWTGEGTSRYSRRVCFPIFGPDLKERGKSYRSYLPTVVPKAIIQLNDKTAISQCWYKMIRTSPVVVLVEDQMSAIKLAPHFHSIALLGTNLSEAKVDEILDQRPRYERVFLALDNDATAEAVRTQLRWRNRLPNLYILGLQKDIKEMDSQEFKEFLARVT